MQSLFTEWRPRAFLPLVTFYLWQALCRLQPEAETCSQVFLDVTDIIDYNIRLLNHTDVEHSFFCLSPDDPTNGFAFDASSLAGHAYAPIDGSTSSDASGDSLLMRLTLGSHLALHIRMQMEQRIGYTSTVGISTSKLLSKLVGNVNKPRGQTTLLPPYQANDEDGSSNVTRFMDAFDIGKVPDIGFKMSHKLREYALKRLGKLDADPMRIEYDYRTQVTVGELRTIPGIDARILEDVLAGPGMQRGIGFRTWSLLHGIDDVEVAPAKATPKQISIEDSYLRLDTMEGVHRELLVLSSSLLRRMRADLTEEASQQSSEADGQKIDLIGRRWLAHPKTLRLSTRPRPPPGADGRRGRASARISRSTDLPNFVFNLTEPVEQMAHRLVQERLLSLFRQLHPEKTGWDLSLINVAATNMVETAGPTKAAIGRDIGKMFRTQEQTLQSWKVEDVDIPPSDPRNEAAGATTMEVDLSPSLVAFGNGSEDALPLSQQSQNAVSQDWLDSDDDDVGGTVTCPLCTAGMPDFALAAHLRFHEAND